jgi:serine-type D-Ala-D-Ala carboxypeptidase (penicillin-binding protein 5/6)
MTAILILELCKRFSIDKYAEEITVTSYESRIGGTSATLREGEIYTIEQLLYGLMLPSGNDASLALATWAGWKLLGEGS